MGAALDQEGGCVIMRRKLNDVRGETLVEVLCAILIGVLSVAMLFSMVMVSVNLNRGAKAADEKLAADLGNAEERGTEVPVSPVPIISADARVTVENKADTITAVATPPVKFYGGDNAVSYALEPTPTPVTPP